jgi:hypothetical protein
MAVPNQEKVIPDVVWEGEGVMSGIYASESEQARPQNLHWEARETLNAYGGAYAADAEVQ